MRKLCESPSLVDLGLIAGYLENEGIAVNILNEYQGGSPGVPHGALSVWAELWIRNPQQYPRALELYDQYRERLSGESAPEWLCATCRENNPGSFESCWKCGQPAVGEPIPQ
jgi:hypothetical protein